MRRERAGAIALRLGAILMLLAATGCAGAFGRKDTTPDPAVVYQAALQKMEKKKYYAARSMLQDLLPRIPPDDRDLLPNVQLTIADGFYLDGGLMNYGEALNSYRSFLTFFPDHERADYAQYMIGMSMFKQVLAPDRDQTMTKRAMIELSKVEALYPFSDYVLDARQAMLQCRHRLGEHERVVGFFYQRREAWEAAIDRYRYVVANFPQFDNMNRLLLDLATCLLAINERIEAGSLIERLTHEDPKGKLAARGQRQLEDFDRKQAKMERKAKKAAQ